MASGMNALPWPLTVRLRQSTTHGAAAGIFTLVSDDRSAEKSSKPQPVGASTLVLVEPGVGLMNVIVRAPTPGRVPLANSSRYV